MLVIQRIEGEGFSVGNSVKIHIVKVRGDKVKIGIEAPRDMEVLRDDAIVRIPQPSKNSEVY